MQDFIKGDKASLRSAKVSINDQISILNLFKSEVSGRTTDDNLGFVVLIEDHSELYKLESELAHSERLASIGRLATGVAHEIGNPKASNMVILGAASPFIHITSEKIEKGIESIFQRKGEKIVKLNIEAFQAGREFAKNQ